MGKVLRPTELAIFGDPDDGAQLMQSSQATAIDLPQKALVWEDMAGDIRFTHNELVYLAERHGITGRVAMQQKISKAPEILLPPRPASALSVLCCFNQG